jgi:ABC-type glycerol-3-phosphate transport system substrate-binding protein
MDEKKLSRRDFLRVSALAAGGAALVGCGAATAEPTKAPQAATQAPAAPTAAPPAASEVTLDVMSLAEYQGPYREIWNAFEGENPGIKINVFSINEDTSAAFEAKVAGGYLDHIELTQETQIFFKNDNYEMALDLSTIDFPWWDRFTFDAKNAWANLFNLPGPRSLDWAQGYVMTWQYNAELMQQAGLDPQKDVKTMDDLYKWMDEGTAWANASGGQVEWFWNQAWHNWIFGVCYSECIPLGWADGALQRITDCWLGKAKFNAADSPYRHFYQFYLDAKDHGWIPENMPQRVWEGDMEASYIGGKSVMMLHGPWVWDKALAAGSDFAVNDKQEGLPATPPAEGMTTWWQSALPPNIDNQWWMRAGVEKLPTWPQNLVAWNWFFSPTAIPLRAQAEGRFPLYTLDTPIDLKGKQYLKVAKFIEDPNGPWPNSKWEQNLTGNVLSSPYRKKGSKGVFDWESNGNNVVFADLFAGKITVQQALDVAQKNWDESFEGLPAA